MIKVLKTDTSNPDFRALVKHLDKYLSVTDGSEHSFYDQYNKLDQIKYTVVIYDNNTPVGCGAIKEFDKNRVEIKRMYVLPTHRGKGIASKILLALEDWATTLTYQSCILECGNRQPDAIACYEKNNYKKITNYGPYSGVENSVCYEKKL